MTIEPTFSESVPLICDQCGYAQIQDGPKGTCLRCGGKSLRITFLETVSMTDFAKAEGNNAYTTRHAKLFDTKKIIPYPEVECFVRLALKEDPSTWRSLLQENVVGNALIEEASRATRIGLKGIYYRARSFAFDPGKLEPKDFFRAPKGKVSIGRYNNAGEPILYLSRSAETAVSEVSGKASLVFVQKFLIDLSSAQWIPFDLDLERTCPHLNSLLFLSEGVPMDGEESHVYRASHLVRTLAEVCNVELIEAPSVRSCEQSDATVNLIAYGNSISLIEETAYEMPFLVR